MVAKIIAAVAALTGLLFFILYEVAFMVAEILALPFIVLYFLFREFFRL